MLYCIAWPMSDSLTKYKFWVVIISFIRVAGVSEQTVNMHH